MADITEWPDALRPAEVEWGIAHSQIGGRSIFDGSLSVDTLGAPLWAFAMSTGPLRAADVPAWEAFIGFLAGRKNRVRAWDWRREAPLGVATGTPLVRTSALGATLQTKGWTPNTTGILLRGSYFGVNGELKKLLLDMNSDASGFATATFEQPLRVAPSVDMPLTLVKPKAKFYMDNVLLMFQQKGARHPGFNLNFLEDPAP